MVVHFLLAFDTVKCRFIRPGRIHLLRNKKERFKEKALEKVRIKKVFQTKLAVLIKMRCAFTFVLKLSCEKSYFNRFGTEASWIISSVTVKEITKDWFRFRLRGAFKPSKWVRRGNRFSFLNAGVHNKFVVNWLTDMREKE